MFDLYYEYVIYDERFHLQKTCLVNSPSINAQLNY